MIAWIQKNNITIKKLSSKMSLFIGIPPKKRNNIKKYYCFFAFIHKQTDLPNVTKFNIVSNCLI
jgi:hypothetical protein